MKPALAPAKPPPRIGLSRRDSAKLAGRQVRHRRTQPPVPPQTRTTAPEGRQKTGGEFPKTAGEYPKTAGEFPRRPCRGVVHLNHDPVVITTG